MEISTPEIAPPTGWKYDGLMMDVAPQYTCIDPNNPLFRVTINLHPGESVEGAIVRAEVRFGVNPLIIQARRTFTKGLDPQ